MRSLPRSCRSIALAAAIAGCGGGGDNPAGPASIDLALSASAVSVVQGSSTTVTVTVARTNFSGDVQLTVENAGSGVTTTLTAAILPASQSQSTLTVNVAPDAATGSASLIVRARGGTVTDKTASLALTVTPAAAYTMSVPASLQIVPGQSGSLNIALTRTSFAGAVLLAVEALPAGATGTFAPNPVAADASVLTLSTGSAAPGTYALTVRATAAGLADRVATFALTISTPSYTMTLGSPTVSLAQGQGTTVNVTLARTSFTGPIAIAVSDLPAGAIASVSPASTTGSTVVLSLNGGTAAPGSYTVTVRGTASGLTDRAASFSLTVAPAPASSNVVFNLCTADTPLWVGYQSGTGAWTSLPVSASRAYSFSVAGVGAIASVVPNGGDGTRFGYETVILYGSAADLQSIGGGACTAAGAKTVSGSVTGVPTSETATVALGHASVTVATGAFSLGGVAEGAHDLLATRDFSNANEEGTSKLIIRRALDPATGSVLPVLDFAAAEAITPAIATLTLSNTAADQTLAYAEFMTANGTSAYMSGTFAVGGQTLYRGVPAGNLLAGDLHAILAFSRGSTSVRGLSTWFTSAVNRSIAMPPAMAATSVSMVASAPYARFRMQVPAQREYGALLFSQYEQFAPAPGPTDRVVGVVATAGYFNGLPPTWVTVVPDLTGASGFNAAWGLVAGAATEFYAEVDGGALLSVAPAEGTMSTFAATGGTTSATGATVASRSPASRRPASVSALRTLPAMRALAVMRRGDAAR
ncbi:MAG TPA: hypothetical protein VM033_06800 [Gemmatimonadaceae bacterium]|nr:hypothetical protein [Gemmatimonadaceae bacterium]